MNNPGEVNEDILKYLREIAENPIQNEPQSSRQNEPQPSTSHKPKVKILQDIQLQPPNNTQDQERNFETDMTQHSTANDGKWQMMVSKS